MLLFGFAFLSGFVTVLAPCIWPLLPIVLSSSVAVKGHRRPLGITLGIMLSFLIFTLTISTLVKLFHFDPNALRLLAVIVIGFFGLTLVIPALNSMVDGLVSKISGAFGIQRNTQDGFWSGFLTGLSLGIVWSPCAGPILATIAVLAAAGNVTLNLFLVTTAYVIGVGIPLFAFAYGGQKIISNTRFLSAYTGRIQQVFGIIMLLTALAIYTNYDKYLEAQLLNDFPQIGSSLTGFENSSLVKSQLDALKGQQSNSLLPTNSDLFNTNTPAPDFVGVTKWLNLPDDKSLTMKDLKGKVVLIDFWTYTCINCIRTLPHVTGWYEKYKDQGFVVIGVHTPEFQFEHDTNNVLNALKMYNIHYPVAQDNDYATWNAYNNLYWPAEYLIDAKGNIRREHFGEGEYDQTELAIQTLLKEAGKQVSTGLVTMPDQTPTSSISPETYVGSKRMQYYYPNGNVGNGAQIFNISKNLPVNTFSLGGDWNITDENATAANNAVLDYHFTASKVYLVIRPGTSQGGKIKVLLDGKIIDPNMSGSDVLSGVITVDSDRLYNLVDLKGKTESHILELQFLTPGIQAFAFTFG